MPGDALQWREFETLVGLRVSRETFDRLRLFVDLFEKWSQRINLVAASTRAQVWHRHVLDSAQLFALSPGANHWIDLGSGGGFPGIVTAILLADQGQGWVDLVESNHKKASFLRSALLETGARGRVHALRIEDAPEALLDCDRISARALADLDMLCGYAEAWTFRNAELRLFLHKGRDYRAEIEKARGRWQFDLVIHPSALEPDSVVLEISGLVRSRER